MVERTRPMATLSEFQRPSGAISVVKAAMLGASASFTTCGAR